MDRGFRSGLELIDREIELRRKEGVLEDDKELKEILQLRARLAELIEKEKK